MSTKKIVREVGEWQTIHEALREASEFLDLWWPDEGCELAGDHKKTFQLREESLDDVPAIVQVNANVLNRNQERVLMNVRWERDQWVLHREVTYRVAHVLILEDEK